MPDENNDDALNVNRPDTRRYETQDNEGHIKGSRQEGNSQEATERIRKQDDQDNSELNKTDARDTVGGNETV